MDGIEADIRERIRTLPPAAYMQVVGIVQSIAMTYLLYNSNQPNGALFLLQAGTLVGHWSAAVQLIVTFLLIVLTWHVNAENVMSVHTGFRIWDSILPFSFAAPEFMMIVNLSIDHFSAWCFSVAGFMILAVSAFIDLGLRMGDKKFATIRRREEGVTLSIYY